MVRRKQQSEPDKPELDHPDQAMDTDLPSEEHVNEEAFKALQDAYEGDPEEES